MKKAALFILCILTAAAVCSCTTPQDITGDTVYRATSEIVVSQAPKNWEHVNSGGGIKMFTITNNTELSFNAVEVKPSGFDGWERVEYDFVAGAQFSYTFAGGDLDKYQKWDFRMRVNFDMYYTITAVNVKEDNIVLDGTLDSPSYKFAKETAVSD